MGSAYAALRAEADYDEATDLASAVDGAAKAVTNLAEVVLPASKFVPLPELAKAGAGQIGGSRQRERIMAANNQLEAVAQLFLTILQEQQSSVLGSIVEIEHRRTKTVQTLIDKGVMSRSDLFGEVLTKAGLSAASNASDTIDKSPLLQNSIDAALRQNAADQLQHRLQRVRSSR